jgi:hypothetical protein
MVQKNETAQNPRSLHSDTAWAESMTWITPLPEIAKAAVTNFRTDTIKLNQAQL